jgi:hypothetical protein
MHIRKQVKFAEDIVCLGHVGFFDPTDHLYRHISDALCIAEQLWAEAQGLTVGDTADTSSKEIR